MNLSNLEEHILAYFLLFDAKNVSIDGRFFLRDEFVRIFERQIFFTILRFGDDIAGRSRHVANALVDHLIESKALSTVQGESSRTSHQLDSVLYKSTLANLIATNSLVTKYKELDPGSWDGIFSALGGEPDA